MIKEIVNETLNELKKSKKEPYPLYYREVFNTLIKDKNIEVDPKLLMDNYKNINEEMLEKTTETTNFIEHTTEDIKKNSKNFIEELEVKDINHEIVSLIKSFESDLITKLNESTNKINELKEELKKAYTELNLDALTKAYSRKALEKDLNKIIEVGQNKQLDIILMAFDLDHFKTINDKYGHLVGDFVLIKVVKIIKNILRPGDKIYRFGGDEFFVIFNRVKPSVAQTLADKILNKVSKTKLKYQENIISLTLSIGATCHKQGDTKETFITRADEALYKSKVTRNKVSIIC